MKKTAILPGMPCALTHSVHHLERMVKELSLSGEFSCESLELLSHDLSGRLFHTWSEQEVTLTGAARGNLVGLRVKNDPVEYWTVKDGIKSV